MSLYFRGFGWQPKYWDRERGYREGEMWELNSSSELKYIHEGDALNNKCTWGSETKGKNGNKEHN